MSHNGIPPKLLHSMAYIAELLRRGHTGEIVIVCHQGGIRRVVRRETETHVWIPPNDESEEAHAVAGRHLR